MRLVTEALGRYGCADAISLVSSRDDVSDLLKLDDYIDLIIPRGSNELVRSIKERSKSIPVLGHADGICHTYLDEHCDLDKAIKIVVDAKTDYPAACNAMETLLVHESLISNEIFYHVKIISPLLLQPKPNIFFPGVQCSQEGGCRDFLRPQALQLVNFWSAKS